MHYIKVCIRNRNVCFAQYMSFQENAQQVFLITCHTALDLPSEEQVRHQE